MPDYKLSPSDLTYLYDGCKHCFVLKVKHGIPQPSIGLPAVFSTIANLQKDYYSGKRTEEFCPALPPGIVQYGEKWVCSEKIPIEGTNSACFIKGRFDIVVEHDDASYAVLDFKTAEPTDEKSELYGRQLHAYALALEKPAPGELKLAPVSRLGLLYFSPTRCEHTAIGSQRIEGSMEWVEVQRDDNSFLNFLTGVVNILDGPLPEPEPAHCDWCAYRQKTGVSNSTNTSATAPSVPNCPTCSSPMCLRTGKFGDFWSCTKYPECKGTRNV